MLSLGKSVNVWIVAKITLMLDSLAYIYWKVSPSLCLRVRQIKRSKAEAFGSNNSYNYKVSVINTFFSERMVSLSTYSIGSRLSRSDANQILRYAYKTIYIYNLCEFKFTEDLREFNSKNISNDLQILIFQSH
jgi:hypothetical protein